MITILIGYIFLFIHRPFEIWPVLATLRLERLYIGFAVAYWLAFTPKQLVPNRLNGAFLFFTLIVLFCWLASPFPEAGAGTVEDYLKVLVFYVLVVTSARDEHDLRRLMGGFLLAMGLYMTHSLWEFHNGRHIYRMGIPRMMGVDQTYSDPNTFAGSIVLALPISFPFWAEASRPGRRRLLAFYTVLSGACVLLTGSRSGLAGLVALVGLAAPSLRRHKGVLLLIVVALVLGITSMSDAVQERFLTLIDSSHSSASARESAQGRKAGFLNGLKLWGQSPLTGYGPGAFGRAIGNNMQAHNLYGQTLGELGSLGALALAGVLGCLARNAGEVRAAYQAHPWARRDFLYHASRAIPLTVILLLLLGWGGHNLYRYNWLWFGSFQVLIVHCVRRKQWPGPEESDALDRAA